MSYFYTNKGRLEWGTLIRVDSNAEGTFYIFSGKKDRKIYKVPGKNLFYKNERLNWKADKSHSER